MSARLHAAYAVWRRVALAGAMLSGVAVLAMMSFIVADVISRNFLGGSIPGSFEVAQNYLMPVTVFPALAYVYGTGVLPRMDLLSGRMPTGLRTGLVHALLAIEVVVFAVLVQYTWAYAVDGRERGVSFPAGGDLFTLWPLFFLVPLGFAMVLVETLFVVVRNLSTGPVLLTMTDHTEVPEL